MYVKYDEGRQLESFTFKVIVLLQFIILTWLK